MEIKIGEKQFKVEIKDLTVGDQEKLLLGMDEVEKADSPSALFGYIRNMILTFTNITEEDYSNILSRDQKKIVKEIMNQIRPFDKGDF